MHEPVWHTAQALVVVPTMELGVQCALTVYKLLGGSLSQGRPGDPANMFTYKGPRDIKVRAVCTCVHGVYTWIRTGWHATISQLSQLLTLLVVQDLSGVDWDF